MSLDPAQRHQIEQDAITAAWEAERLAAVIAERSTGERWIHCNLRSSRYLARAELNAPK